MIDPDADSISLILLTSHNAALALDAKIDELQDKPVADMGRATRVALTGLRPAFEQRLQWQRWAAIVAASAAGTGAAALIYMAIWSTAMSVARHDSNAEAALWDATCADQAPRRVMVAGKSVCQVPIEQTAGK